MERDADRIADRVTEPGRREAVVGPREVPGVMRSATGAMPALSAPLSSVVARAGPGRPLDGPVRQTMEEGLGSSLSAVRIHTDSAAAESAYALGARAYTVGNHIVFGASGYEPGSATGRRLLAHELAHVVQAQSARVQPAILRQACGHDGRQTGCSGSGRWTLEDMVTKVIESVGIDDLIVNDGLAKIFGGTWATQVQTPPNPLKAGKDRGRVDGMKVDAGTALKVEVVEVKPRSTQFAGGCALATRETGGYVRELTRIAPRVVEISQRLAPVGGLRIEESDTAADRRVFRAAGIDLKDPLTRQAWGFYNSLQKRLNRTFTSPFTAMEARANTDGTPSESYPVRTVAVACKTRKCEGYKPRSLVFQVNNAGGVSYGCEDGKCECEDEEKKEAQKDVKQVPKAAARPADQPSAQPRAADPSQPGDKPAEHPTPKPAHDPTIPIVVGAGAAVATVAAVAWRRAVQKAALQAAQAEFRRRAEEAAAKRVARATAGKAAGKAAAYVEVAAAAALIIFYSDRAEAKVGPGESPISTLYKAMTANGHPPSPEMKALIESDPVLKELAEHAAESGDASALNEEATKRVLQLVHDNPGEFDPDDLAMLAEFCQTSSIAGKPPQTVEDLKHAIEAARQHNAGKGGTGGTGGQGGAGAQGGAAAPQAPPQPQAPPTPGAPSPHAPPQPQAPPTAAAPGGGAAGTPTPVKSLPGLTDAGRKLLPAPGVPVRRLFDAMVGQTGTGASVTDEAVRRFLATVPSTLSATDANTLIGQLQPTSSETLDEVLERLKASIDALAKKRAAAPRQAETKLPAATTTQPAQQPSSPLQGEALHKYIESALKEMRNFSAWASISSGSVRFFPTEDADWRTAPPHTKIIGWGLVRLSGGKHTHAAAGMQIEVVDRAGNQTRCRITYALPAVYEDGTTDTSLITIGKTVTMSDPK